MRRLRSFFHPVLVFVLAQLAWGSLLALWIYWFISNYIILSGRVSPPTDLRPINVIALVSGVVLLIGISFALSLIFLFLSRQLNLTRTYDNFIANVTHELKSPLASIQLHLQTLQTRDVPAEKQKYFMELMTKDAVRLRRLIDSILEVSGLEEKRLLFDYHVHNGSTLVREIIDEVVDQFKLPNEAVHVEGTPDCKCVVNRDAIRMVFVNLFDNSIKYTNNPVEVRIRIAADKKWLTIAFSDKGIGILPRDQKKVFSKFHRIYNRNSPNVMGTGLGLYWTREIIRHHKGHIGVFSAGAEKGTTFTIQLPVYNRTTRLQLRDLLRRSRRKEELGEPTE